MPSLRRLALPALLLPVLAALPLALAGPAAADVTGTASTPDVVLYDHCQQHQIAYDVVVSPGTTLWRLEVQVADPQGVASEGTVLNSSAGAATSGTVPVTFCGSEQPGTWTVRSTGFYEVLPALQIPFTLPATTFEVRPAATRTTLAQRSLGHGRHRLDTRVLRQDERGFEKSDGVTVRLEQLVHGEWRTLRGTRQTTVHGRTVTTLTGRPGTKVRAVVPARNNYAASTSRPVRL